MMLICFSGMGLFSVIENAYANSGSPCHKEMMSEVEDVETDCEACEIAIKT